LIRAHRADQALIETPELMEKFMGARLGLEPAKIDVFFTPGETLTAVGREFEVRHVPGHCAGNVLFYAAPLNGSTGATTSTAFVGDALFKAGVGRWDLQGGGFAVLAQSIRSQIYTLPDDTIVFPGHGPRTTVGEEKATNPYVPLIAAARPV
jgi:glyoxylase-like metal-dependent hydrolase (beta-lactamase superfamily II)